MAWSIVGVGTSVEVTATAHALTVPAGVAQGDLLIACIASRIASTTSITLPTGGEWTLVGEQKANNILSTGSAVASAMMAYCVRGASNPNLTFTHPAAPAPALGRIVAYRGGATPTASAKDTQTSATTAISITAVNLAGLTTTTANDLIVAMLAGGQEAAWSSFNATTPSGASGATDTTTAPSTTTWIERADVQTTTGNDTSLGIFDAVKTAAGATGNFTATASVAASHALVAGAFKILSVVNISVPVTGQEATASVGTSAATAVTNISVPVQGQALAVSLGPPPQPISFAVSGGPLWADFVSGTTVARQYMGSASYIAETVREVSAVTVVIGEVGGVSVSVFVTGQTLTAFVGDATVTSVGTVSVPVTGQSVAAFVGDATVDVEIAAGATRQYIIGSPLGATYVSDTGDDSYALVGGYITETATAVPSGDVSVFLTGQSANASVGSVSVATVAGIGVDVTGQQLSASVGTATVSAVQRATADVTGQSVTVAIGDVSVTAKQNVSASVAGQQITVSAGTIGITAGGSVSTGVTGQAVNVSCGTVTVAAAGLAGFSVWTGSVWVDKPAKVWDGAVWAQKPVKHWTGSAWV